MIGPAGWFAVLAAGVVGAAGLVFWHGRQVAGFEAAIVARETAAHKAALDAEAAAAGWRWMGDQIAGQAEAIARAARQTDRAAAAEPIIKEVVRVSPSVCVIDDAAALALNGLRGAAS